MTTRTKILLGIVGALAVIAPAGVAFYRFRDRGAEVRIETVARRDLISTVTASGIIQPSRRVDISADLSGRVIQLAVEEGQLVQRGDLLLRIDPTGYQAAVRRAEAAVAQVRAQEAQTRANLLQAQSAARRAGQLAGSDGLISAQELEQARTNAEVAEAQMQSSQYAVRQAEATLLEAGELLNKTTIVAPMSGRVTRLNIEEGETAIVGTMNNAGSLLLTVADLSVMEAAVRVDETDVPYLTHGDSAIVRIDAFPDQVFSGRVTRISNSALQAGSSGSTQQGQTQAVDFEVIITIDAPPAELRTDLSATAEIVTAMRQHVLAVPIIGVTVRDSAGQRFEAQEDEEGPAGTPVEITDDETSDEVEGVFRFRDGKAEFQPIRLGIAGDRYFEVQDGLAEGDTVIAGPYAAVRDLEGGDEVRLVQAEADEDRWPW